MFENKIMFALSLTYKSFDGLKYFAKVNSGVKHKYSTNTPIET